MGKRDTSKKKRRIRNENTGPYPVSNTIRPASNTIRASIKRKDICKTDICNFVKNGDLNYVPGITQIANETNEHDQKKMFDQFYNIFLNRYRNDEVCIFKRNLDGTNLMLWKEGEYNESIQKLYNIFTQKVTSHCLMNEFIEDNNSSNKCNLEDIKPIANIMNEESENIENIEDIEDILETLDLNNGPGLKLGGKLTMKGGDISLFKKFFKINMALMYNDELMNEMSNTTKEIITKYIIAGINGYRELVTFAFEKAYDVQCQQDFLFFLIKNTVNGFYRFKNNIWPFIMANAPILINDIRKGIDTANTVAENIDNHIAQYIHENIKENNQKALADHLGKITTEKLNEEHNKALERQGRLQTIRNMYEKKITELKIDTEEIQKEQQDADEETNLIKSYEQEFAKAFEANQMAIKALNEVKYELQETIDNAIFDNTKVNTAAEEALKSGRNVAREAYPDTNSVLDLFTTNEERKTEKENVLTTALRKAAEEKEEKEAAVANNMNVAEEDMNVAEAGEEKGGGTRKKRTSRKGKKKASKNRKTKARRARKSRKTKK